MKEWLTEAVIAKLEDEIDAMEGLAFLAEAEDTMLLEDYLKSRKDGGGQNKPKWKGIK